MSIYKTEALVKKVLEEYEDSRSDDFILIYRVYKEINEDAMIRELFCEVMVNHKLYELPPFETISRVRRKLQAQHEELRANKKIDKARLNKTIEYRNYAMS